jgi:gluconolactonase
MEALCGDFGFVEGPVWHRDRLYFSDIPRSKRFVWSDGAGLREVSGETNKGNGMDIDAEGGLLVCEHTTSSVTRFPDPSSDEGRRVVASHFDGMELNSPNDVVSTPDGAFYFTDPVYGRTNESVGLLRRSNFRSGGCCG